MTKPTLMQSLLNQPSQSYSIDIPRTQHQRSMSPASPPQQLKPPPTSYRHRLSYNEFEDLDPSEESDLEDLFFTPNTSPRTSMASSLLMFPTGRKPSRRSLRLSDSSDTVILASATPPSSPTTKGMPPAPAVLSTRTTAAPKRQYPPQNQRNIHDAISSSLSTTSLEPHSPLSGYIGSLDQVQVTTTTATDLDDKKMGRGITKRTRHGLVTIPSAIESTKSSSTSKQKNSLADGGDVKRSVPAPSSSPLPVSATNGSAASKRRSNQQGLVDGDLTKDVKRPMPTSSSSPPTVSATNGSAVTAASKRKTVQQGLPDGDLTKDAKRSVPTSITHPPATVSSTSNGSAAPVKIATTTVGPPHVLASRKPSKSQAPTDPGPAASSKENMKSDVVMKAEVPKMKEKEKEVDALTPSSSKLTKDKGRAKPNATPAPTPTPHTFSAFAPLPTPSSAPPANENTNSSNSKPSLPPAGFSFPPPPSHSPQLPPLQPPQQRNSLNGSAAAYTYALRHKGNSSPKPGGASGSGNMLMNMAALLEEDEVDEGGDGSTPSRRLRRVPNGNGKGKGKEKRISDSTDSSHRSYSASHSQLNANSHSHSEGSTIRRPPKTMTSEVNAMSLSTPGELPSNGTQGFTSLVLPRAPLPLGSHSISIRSASTSGSGSRKWFGSVGKEGKIDLTRSGLAQTTMASVEVVRGLGSQNGLGGKLMGILRKRTVSSGTTRPRPIEGLSRPEDLPPIRKAPTAGAEGTVLGFTSYRKPPGYIPSSCVLVQVWAVGVDGVDGRLVGVNFGDHVWRVGGYEDEEGGMESEWEREAQKAEESEEVDISKSTPQQGISGLGRSFSLKRKPRGSVGSGPSRTFSLKRNNTPQSQHHILTKSSSQKQSQRRKILQKATHKAEVGYIPGRSFVGRVLECGWDVRDETIKKGEWVVGLLDIKKCGALTEFIVVDRHRIHRVPHPCKSPEQQDDHSNMAAEQNQNDDGLTLEELALLPLCGIPAYRAVRTFIYAFSSLGEGTTVAHDRRGVESGSTHGSRIITNTEHPQDGRRRVLVLRGHDGAGAMAVQLLAKRGWKVSVHVPFSASSTTCDPTTTEVDDVDPLPRNIQERARDWGADEIIFDEEVGDGIDDGRIAAIRVMESLREDGDMFDAILDTVGGKEVREAGERLLKSAGGVTTPSGFEPPISPRARDKGIGVGQYTTLVGDVPERPIPTTADHLKAGFRSFGAESARNVDEGITDMKGSKVGYAWVGVAQDVDWDGEDISETLGSVLRLALEEGVRPVIGARYRVVPFEQAPYVFVDKGPLGHGCNVVIKVAG